MALAMEDLIPRHNILSLLKLQDADADAGADAAAGDGNDVDLQRLTACETSLRAGPQTAAISSHLQS